MIPKVAQSGRSFKGAAQYYLHDKKANTSERVAFVEMLNLPTVNADRAIAHMIDTATHADELKQAAGMKSGRKLQKPVYVYSLAWHPDEAPNQAEQVAAARETIEALGLSDRQALIVSHNDTDHPHVHVIVNRVCPETGKAAVMSNDQLILSKWAEDYEQKHGKVHCQARVENNAEREKGQWKKYNAQNRRDQYEWKKQTTKEIWNEYRAERDGAKDSRKPMYEALWQQRENRMAARQSEIKQLFKPQWRDLFKQQRIELKKFDTRLSPRLKFALQNPQGNKFMAILRAFTADQGQRQEFIKQQDQERKNLGQIQTQSIRDAGREVTKAWKCDRDQLQAMHKGDDKQRLERYRSATEAVWNKNRGNTPSNELEASQEPKKARSGAKRNRIRDKFERDRSRNRPRPR